ncbi:MAG: HAD family hydrolase [Candidatus Eisenbacteria bacterium]|nr:HAD family hydrolase [Candidatus Eisenbacteria bacterium]
MRDIDLRNARAILFDRGNVTHDCRFGPPQSEREQQSARLLSAHLERLTGRTVDALVILERLVAPWKQTFAERASRGYEEPLETRFRDFLASLGTEASGREVDEMIDLFGWAYVEPDKAREGVASLMSTLRAAGKKVGIVSNAALPDRIYVRKYVNDRLDPFIGCYVFSYGAGTRKPDKRMLELACRSLGVSPEESVLVGDRIGADIACARRCGAVSVWYNPTHDVNTSDIKPDYSVESFADMEERIAT